MGERSAVEQAARTRGGAPRVSRAVVFGVVAVVPPVGVLLAFLLTVVTVDSAFLPVAFVLLVACLPGAFFGVEAATRARKELRHPAAVRPRRAELGLVLGLVGALLSVVIGLVALLGYLALT